MADLTDKTDDIALWDEGRTKSVDVITDGASKNRLAVDALDSNAAYSGAGKLYSISIDALTIAAATEAPFILVKNAVASGKVLYIYEFVYSTDASTSIVKFYRDPTITANGTALTGVNFLKSGAALTATVFRSGTVSANGTLLRTERTATGTDQIISVNTVRPIQAGENFLITLTPQASKVHYATLVFAEV